MVPRAAAVVATLLIALFAAPAAFANQNADLDQCENGPLSAPHSCAFSIADPDPWINGNLGASKAHYVEDEVVPFRMVLTGMTPGAHTVNIQWDTLKSGKHAYDFIYNYNYTEKTADPCVGIAGCGLGNVSYFAIPHDPTVPEAYYNPGMPDSGSMHEGEMTLFGGTLTGVSTPAHPGGTDDPANVTVSFTIPAGTTTAVLAWGGHIADHHDWGPGSAAANIPGSPYHMRLLDLDGSGGNQDRSISSDAIFFPSTITIIKDATPNAAQDFSFSTTGGLTPATFALDDDNDPTLSNTQAYPPIISATKNTYSVTEGTTTGWTLRDIQCTTVAAGSASVDDQTIDVAGGKVTIPLDEGEEITCKYFNDAIAPSLTVIKHVINDDGGSLSASDFTMQVHDDGTDPPSFPGAESPGTTLDIDAGAYDVTETEDPGYAASYSPGCTGTLSYGQSATCTITNNDKPATLNVIKHVINDDGGTKVANDFAISVTGNGASPSSFNGKESPGTPVDINAGSFNVTETEDPGYAASYSGCSGTIANGETKTCTITNNDKPATLTVIKKVVNDDGGTKVPSDFTMDVTGTNASPSSFPGDAAGTTVDIDAGAYSVGESGADGYTASYSSDCSGTIANGASKTCTVTNDDNAIGIDVEKQVSLSANGPFVDGPVQAYVGDTLYFEMTVANDGAAPLTVAFSDPRCDTGTLTGPDGDGGVSGTLDVGETWTYHCSHVVTDADGQAFDNVASATGSSASGGQVHDSDNAGATISHPAVHIEKTGPATAEAGKDVSYDLLVTNPGDVALDGQTLKVTDPQCAAPPSLVAKSRGNGADPTPSTLDPGDSWLYRCAVATQVGQTSVVNLGKVCGNDVVGGREVCDDDDATTALTQPQIQVLPDIVVSGASKLTGPAGCVKRAFKVRITGRQIAKVQITIDGRTVKTFRNAAGTGKRFVLTVNPGRYGKGIHRLQAKVTYNAKSETRPRTLRMAFERCAKQRIAPEFTG